MKGVEKLRSKIMVMPRRYIRTSEYAQLLGKIYFGTVKEGPYNTDKFKE